MEAKIKQILGEQVFAIALLQSQNEILSKEIESLKAQLKAKTAKKAK